MREEANETREGKSPGSTSFTREEAAKYMNVKTEFFDVLVFAGDIPRMTFGPRMFRYDKADCDAYMARSKKTPKTNGKMRIRLT